MKKHLAIFSKQAINRIFDGHKTVESRFSQSRIPPFGQINVGDIVYIKPPGEEIVGQFTVSKVISFENLDIEDWAQIINPYKDKLSFGSDESDKKFFDSKKTSHFGTVIFMDQIEKFLTPPIRIKKKDLRGWVVLD